MAPLSLNDALAIERTQLANERTFLAYVRTALALAAGAAAVLQFFPADHHVHDAAYALMVAGVVLLLVGSWRCWKISRQLKQRRRSDQLP